MTRLKLAELTSGIGALVLGVGLGALFADWFAPGAGFVMLGGAFAHGFSMWDQHRLERQRGASDGPWIAVLYWTCWLLLAVLGVFLIARS